LRGKSKLTLTTPILVTINGYFQKITEGNDRYYFLHEYLENMEKQAFFNST